MFPNKKKSTTFPPTDSVSPSYKSVCPLCLSINPQCSMASKRKTTEFKQRVIKQDEENPSKKKSEITKEFNIPPTTLSTIIKNIDKYENASGQSKRTKGCECRDLEESVLTWLKQCSDKNLRIIGPQLHEKTQEFARTLGPETFCGSNGWLHNFKRRHEVMFKTLCGESSSINNGKTD